MVEFGDDSSTGSREPILVPVLFSLVRRFVRSVVRTIVDYNDLSRRFTRTPLGSREIPRRRFPPKETSGAAQECSEKKRHIFDDPVVDDNPKPKKNSL
jgi:hypothetical protein